MCGPERWSDFEPLYLKLTAIKDVKIKKTLAHSLFELAKMLGPAITESTLMPVAKRYLDDKLPEIRDGVLC